MLSFDIYTKNIFLRPSESIELEVGVSLWFFYQNRYLDYTKRLKKVLNYIDLNENNLQVTSQKNTQLLIEICCDFENVSKGLVGGASNSDISKIKKEILLLYKTDLSEFKFLFKAYNGLIEHTKPFLLR